jgi:hypothetical protein
MEPKNISGTLSIEQGLAKKLHGWIGFFIKIQNQLLERVIVRFSQILVRYWMKIGQIYGQIFYVLGQIE